MKKFLRGLILFVVVMLSLFIGVKDLDWRVFFQGEQQLIFWATRLPRTVSLLVAGSTLSVCGLVMQQLTQNKFVSPTTAGTMDSARLGILVVMIFLPNAPLLLRSTVAFLFAFGGTILFLQLTRFLPGKNQVMVPLIGSCLAISSVPLRPFLPINCNWCKICPLGYRAILPLLCGGAMNCCI